MPVYEPWNAERGGEIIADLAHVKGGTLVGQTDAQGRDTIDYGWSQNRYVYPEDIEATIYSALGINWTTTRHDDPLGRAALECGIAAGDDGGSRQETATANVGLRLD